MPKKPLISVVVPVYNVEGYIKRCIDSIRNQTIKDIEIILIDDGSTDNSGKICDDFSKFDNRIFVYHTKNKGVSSARNLGIACANGEYIGFVDSDDYIENNMYEFLYNNIKKYCAEISVCGRNNIYDRYTKEDKQFFKICTSEEAIICEIIHEGYSSCNKLYSKKILQGIEFDVKIINGEDRLFVFESFCKSKCIVYDFLPLYNYYHRSYSAGTGDFKIEDYSLVEACNKTLVLCKNGYINAIPYAEKMLWESKEYLVGKILFSSNMEMHINLLYEIKNDIKRNIIKILGNNVISYSRKIAALVIIINFKLYKKIILIKRQKQNRYLNK